MQGCPRNIKVLPKVLHTSPTRALCDVQHDTVRGPPPLIGEGVSLRFGKPSDRVFGEHRKLPCVLPRFELLEVTHGKNVRSSKRGSTHGRDRKSTRLNSSHGYISYAVFCLKKKKQ